MKKTILMAMLLSAQALMAREIYDINQSWQSVCWPEGSKDSLVLNAVDLPHNWDDYYGYRQYTHGNLHGTARYVRHFSLADLAQQSQPKALTDKLFTLRMEGAGSYVTVVVNGHEVCRHQPAGRIVTSLNITSWLHTSDPQADNELVITCEHPSNITDMPWVCGGCSSEWGFSEGSAPLGLFRRVCIVETSKLRIEPFGVHVWANESRDTVYFDTELHNYSSQTQSGTLISSMEEQQASSNYQLAPNETITLHQAMAVKNLRIWTSDHPELYLVSTTLLSSANEELDNVLTSTGFANIRWPKRNADGKLDDQDHCFYQDGQATFIHGTCEYEHLFGQGHALSNEEIDYRCQTLKHLGFNALRDAHQPHNLRYAEHWAKDGMLWWPQFSAHIWYDTPQFRENFKTLLRQWVKERRNNPAIILWGLQNESTMPEDFSRECANIIRELDPECSTSTHRTGRLITTCNGGSGTDWNVIQNWSGTYGGKLEEYGQELAKDDQLLNGEYGGWRTIGLHDMNEKWSEEQQCALLHTKMSLAWQNRQHVCGEFQWIIASHDNPGRQQPDEYIRKIDKIGPLNYKGILSVLWEPTEAYYLYLAWGNFLHGKWPQDKPTPDKLTALEMVAYGRELEGVQNLDIPAGSLLQRYTPHYEAQTTSLKPMKGRTYLYRYNCGGDALIDSWGNEWMGDDTIYSYSWAMSLRFSADSLCPVLASQGVLNGYVLTDKNTAAAEADQPLLKSYRYGRHEMKFSFPVPAGFTYHVEFWWVNVKGELMQSNFDTDSVINGQLNFQWLHQKIGQAMVSAIAISIDTKQAKKCMKRMPETSTVPGYPYSQGLTWAMLDTMCVAKTDKASLPADKGGRPSAKFAVVEGQQAFNVQMGLAQEYAMRFRYKNLQPTIRAKWQLLAQQDGRLVAEGNITLPQTPDKFKLVSTTTGTFVNAGSYRLVIEGAEGVTFENVEIQ